MRVPLAQRDSPRSHLEVGDARTIFLKTNRIQAQVRPEISRSWQRSRAAGFILTTQAWPVVSKPPEVTSLAKAFEEELRARQEVLNRLGLAAILVDAGGTVVTHFGIPDGLENVHLVRPGALPPFGASLREGAVGTHAANLALDCSSPAQVVGHEHLHERYIGMHSAAVPLVGVTTTRTIGALVIESTTPAQPLLLPWAVEVAEAIRSRLRRACESNEMLLMRTFLSLRSASRYPLICLDQQTLLCNAAASRLLGSGDQALLWEYASRFLKGEAANSTLLALSDNGVHVARFGTIDGCDGAAGVCITLRAQKERVSPSHASGSIKAALESALPTQGRRWLRLIDELATYLSASDRIILVGEAGTGKRHIARALLPGAIESDGAAEATTLALLRCRAARPQPVIVTHAERLSDAALVEITQIMKAQCRPDAPVVFTMTTRGRELETVTPRGDGIGHRIQIPALRDRLDDLPALVAAFSANSAERDHSPLRWMPDALQVLARVDWPENLRSLQSVIDAVARDCRTGYVDSRHLPEGVRVQASGRQLSRLEQLEASEILASLRESGGNKLVAANRLGIARSTLYRRMRSLGMDMTAVNF